MFLQCEICFVLLVWAEPTLPIMIKYAMYTVCTHKYDFLSRAKSKTCVTPVIPEFQHNFEPAHLLECTRIQAVLNCLKVSKKG